jgi:molybdate transport system substrate-binding protein
MSEDDRPVVLFAPGSIAPVRDALLSGFAAAAPNVALEIEPPAYSGVLARRILDGAPADVFIAADPISMAPLVRAGLVPAPRALAGNRLALVVRRDLAGQVAGLADLTRDGVRLLLPPAADDPLGRYANQLFDRAGLADRIVRKRTRGEIPDALPGLVAGLTTGTIDAAVIYATSAPQFAGVAAVLPLPAGLDLHDRIVFVVGEVIRHDASRPGARRLVEFLLGPAGQTILRAAGFLPPPAQVNATDASFARIDVDG